LRVADTIVRNQLRTRGLSRPVASPFPAVLLEAMTFADGKLRGSAGGYCKNNAHEWHVVR
jgi:hypothetical protein